MRKLQRPQDQYKDDDAPGDPGYPIPNVLFSRFLIAMPNIWLHPVSAAYHIASHHFSRPSD
jgi:hypothetical protein